MNERLLDEARLAQERLIEADHAADVARAEFHRAVRRLHLSGASLRELAAALHLSHQRVHQIVEGAGGGRRWGHRGSLKADPACSFCGAAQAATRRLVAGPHIYICESCVGVAETVIATARPGRTGLGQMVAVTAEMIGSRCGFCGKSRQQIDAIATSVGIKAGRPAADAAICAECLALCREIHAEELA